MPKKLRLRTNFVWTAVGTGFNAAAQLAVFAVIQKIMGVESLGQYVLAQAISFPVFLFTSLSLSRFMVVDVGDSHTFGEYFGARLFLNIFATSLVLGIALAGRNESQFVYTVLLVAIFHSILRTSVIIQAVFQKHECMNYLGISRILQGASTITGMSLGCYVTGNLFGGLSLLCLLSLIKFVFYDLRNVQRFASFKPRLHFSLSKQLICKCWVISLSAGAVSVTGNLPRYLIEAYMGTASVGFFSGITVITMGMSLAIISLVLSAVRRLAVYFQSDLSSFKKLFFKLMLIAMVIGLANILLTVVIGKYFLRIFFDISYVQYFPAMCVYAVSGMFTAAVAIAGDTIISTRHYWWRIIASFVRFIIVFVASFYLISRFQLLGVSFACVMGAVVELSVCIFGLSRISKAQKKKQYLSCANNQDYNIAANLDV